MSKRVPADLMNRDKGVWTTDLPVLREGVFRSGDRSADYILLRPAPDQWVVIALTSPEPEAPRLLIMTGGTNEAEAFRRMAQRLNQPGSPTVSDAFATDWAMHAPER